jgi:riboflavin synthase
MFTGIVEEIGQVNKATQDGLTISAKKILDGSCIGDSISVNGVCLTITSIGDGSFSVDVMPETMRLTNLGGLHYGDPVNLERAISTGSRFGGHFVQGHVDGIGKIKSIVSEGKAEIIYVSAPAEIMHYIVKKGFIAIDGISLTVVNYDNLSFSVSLVMHTKQNTTLGKRRHGEIVNLEVDIMAKYVERLGQRDNQGITVDYLEKHDFLTSR